MRVATGSWGRSKPALDGPVSQTDQAKGNDMPNSNESSLKKRLWVKRGVVGTLIFALMGASPNPTSAADIPAPTPAGSPVYLARTWFHRGPGLNLLTTPGGQRVVVDNEGHHLTDESINRDCNRFIKLSLDSIQKFDGDYYLALPRGYRGNSVYDWFRVSHGAQFLDARALATAVEAQESVHKPWFSTFGFYFDYERVRGDAGMLLFPKAGLAVTCARQTDDAHGFAVTPAGADGVPQPFTDKDSVAVPIQSTSGRSVRTANFADRVIADPEGQGFWYIGVQNGKLAVMHARPELKPDGGRTLNFSRVVVVGDAASEEFEAGAAGPGELYLLLAHVDNAIGGVDAQRRLLRIDEADGKMAQTTLSFQRYIADARLALCGDQVAACARHELIVLDSKTLAPRWSKSVAELSDHSPLHYRIYRVFGNPAGAQWGVALATAYRKPGEPTRVVVLDGQGAVQQQWLLKPGSVDDATFTQDGGVLFFSGAYTAKLGGSVPVLQNEAASIAEADRSSAAAKPGASAAKAADPAAFLKTPLADRHQIWFAQPGGDFLPLGNGSLGAMMFGGTDPMKVVLDVDSMWAGDEHHQGTFQYLGVLSFALGQNPKAVTDCRRALDLRTGLYTMTYRYQGVTYKREAFCSYPRGLLAIRLTADKPGALSGQLQLAVEQDAKFTKDKDGITFWGQKSNGQKYACVMRVQATGGQVLPAQGKDGVLVTKYRNRTSRTVYNSIALEGCDSVTLYIAGDTNYAMDPAHHFVGLDPLKKIAPRIANIGKLTFEQMQAESAADVAALFDRCTLDLATTTPQAETLPVDRRHAAYRDRLYRGESPDVGFQQLAFDAARYMMIACSRPGSLPANLQGLWNEGNGAAWTGDYHTDINLEMNYWFVEPANLAECALPLFDYIHSQIPFWRQKAQEHFGPKVRGWTVDYMNNIFGAGTYMNYPPGSAWLAWHYAQHFKFGQDMNFLQTRAYPVLKELSQQWQDLLIRRPDGQLTTPKTMSPEHPPQQYGISQDREMIYNLLSNYLAAAARLKSDAQFVKQVQDLRTHIVPPKIGRWGQLQEWETDRDSRYCHHRHMMHEFAAFPGSQINPSATPELAAAAIKSLEARGPGSTGWSKAWRISLYARLHRPELAYQALATVLITFHDNLIWEGRDQIDAPCGYAAGVCELLLQSYKPLDDNDTRFEIDLLPALPKEWPAGQVKGLRARGGYEVDEQWQDGKLTQAVIHNVSSPSPQCAVRYEGHTREIDLAQGASQVLRIDDFRN